MIKIYLTENCGLDDKVKNVLSQHISAPINILRTENGKPYIEGDPLYFNISHSGDIAAIAVSDSPVGVDIEKIKGSTPKHLLSRFSQREQGEIACEADFFKHWTAREAFIKMKGETLAKTLNRLEFFGGKIYLDGQSQQIKILTEVGDGYVVAVCGNGDKYDCIRYCDGERSGTDNTQS